MLLMIGIFLSCFCAASLNIYIYISIFKYYRLNVTSLDYPTTAEKAFELGPPSVRRFAKVAR